MDVVLAPKPVHFPLHPTQRSILLLPMVKLCACKFPIKALEELDQSIYVILNINFFNNLSPNDLKIHF